MRMLPGVENIEKYDLSVPYLPRLFAREF